jgi:hypothetical protein
MKLHHGGIYQQYIFLTFLRTNIMSPTHFAVLIGIDFYKSSPLKSCVQDVNLVERYLRSLRDKQRIHALEITRLTASNPIGEAPSGRPPEDNETLPNLENIKRTLKNVASKSRKKDHVYIHYSGHGTRTEDGAFALAPFGCDQNENNHLRDYLEGQDLVSILNEIVEKGVKVLLVLDCCFSGEMPRDDVADASRYIPLRPSMGLITGDLQLPGNDLSEEPSGVAFRGSVLSRKWVMDPDGYTILTACAPGQVTYGVRAGNELYGPLTYAFVRSLERLEALTMSHQVIFRFICARFKALGSYQVPQLKGSGAFTFFGHLICIDDSFYPILKSMDGKIVLQAGMLMGISEGEKLAMSPMCAMAGETGDDDIELGTARNVGGVTSQIVPDNGRKIHIDGGWVARPLKFCQGVAGAPSDHKTLKWDRRNSTGNRHNKTSEALNDDWILPPGVVDSEKAPVKARINQQSMFEILNRDLRILSIDGTSALATDSLYEQAHALSVLAYLAKWHELAQMEDFNKYSSLKTSIDVGIYKDSRPLDTDSEIPVFQFGEGELLKLTITNLGDENVFVNIYYLTEDWNIDPRLAQENTILYAMNAFQDPFHKNSLEVGDKIKITESSHHNRVSIIKVIITTRNVPLGSMAIVNPLLRAPWFDSYRISEELPDPWAVWTYKIIVGDVSGTSYRS